MEWTNDLSLKFVNIYEKFPNLWDPTHKFYKITPKRNEAWVAISEELQIGVPELKKKITSLLATYRKVRQKLVTPGKSGSGADDVDSSPVWFAYKAFGFLHAKYKPKATINTEVGLEWTESQNEEIRSGDEDNSHDVNTQETSDDAQMEDNKTTPPPTKIKKVFVAPKTKNLQKSAGSEDPRIGEAYTALQTALKTKKDEFDAYGEYIANVLRSMDKRTCAYVKKEFGEIIFKAEIGTYASHFLTQAQPYYHGQLRADTPSLHPLSSPDSSRPGSRDSDNSSRSSYVPLPSTIIMPSVANQSSLSQLYPLEPDPSNNANLYDENSGLKWN